MRVDDAALLAAAADLPVAAIYHRSGFEWQSLRSLGEPVERVRRLRLGGMTLEQLAHSVHDQSARRATILRDLSLDDLRAQLVRANDPGRRYIANFHRGPVLGWGGGHHSPLAGYLASHDLALILDVNRRVGPWLVTAEGLHAAVSTVDPSSRRSRGLLEID